MIMLQQTGFRAIAAIATIVITLSMFFALSAEEWETRGPGRVLVNQKTTPGVRRIIFDPLKAAPGKYWCSTGLFFDPAAPINTVNFEIRGELPGSLTFKMRTDRGEDIYRTVKLYSEWDTVSFDFPGQPKLLTSVELIFNGSQPATTVELRNIAIKEKPKRRELARFWMPGTIPAPIPGYRIETTINSCWRNSDNEFPGIDIPKGREMALDIARRLQREFGSVSVAVVFGKVTEPDAAEFVRKMNALGVTVVAEGHDNPPAELVKNHGWAAVDINGKNYPDHFHNADKTNPEVLSHLQSNLKLAAEAGAAVYRSVDYTWQHLGGPVWGYSEAAKRRWVEDLKGTDGKIEILDGNGRRRVDFCEYFKSYFGFEMTPADCGLTSWDAFVPPAANEPDSPARRNRKRLFIALYHYEWLKFLNESVRPYDKLGMRAQPTLNPESQFNGTDLYWMLKLSLTRGWCTEWWNSAPVIVPVYYHSAYYGNVADKFHKEIIHLGESGAAGNGFGTIPNYWDNMANYLITYVKSASCDAKVMNDQYWAASYENMTDPKHSMPHEMYTAFCSAWSGFLQSKHDRAKKIASGVLVIQNRAVMHNLPPFDVGYGDAPGSIARDLIEQNIIYDGAAFPMEDAYNLNDYRVIVYTPFEAPQGFSGRLSQWLTAMPGRVIITHGDAVNRVAAPVTSLAAEKAPFRSGKGFAGLPELMAGHVNSGVLSVSDPEMAAILKPWIGRIVTFPAALAEAPGGKVLATVGGVPLISEFPVGSSRVIYLHNAPIEEGTEGRKLQKALVAAAMRRANITPAAYSPDDRRVLVFDRGNSPGKVVFIINVKANTNMERDGKVYRVFQAQNPDAAGVVRIAGFVSGNQYLVTDMITQKTNPVTADDRGMIEISFNGWDLRGVYIDPVK